jgi:hypothetical protein
MRLGDARRRTGVPRPQFAAAQSYSEGEDTARAHAREGRLVGRARVAHAAPGGISTVGGFDQVRAPDDLHTGSGGQDGRAAPGPPGTRPRRGFAQSKNHYGSRSRRGTQVAALFYSLIESAKLGGVDPKAYLLRAVRAALATPGTVTLPHALRG